MDKKTCVFIFWSKLYKCPSIEQYFNKGENKKIGIISETKEQAEKQDRLAIRWAT